MPKLLDEYEAPPRLDLAAEYAPAPKPALADEYAQAPASLRLGQMGRGAGLDLEQAGEFGRPLVASAARVAGPLLGAAVPVLAAGPTAGASLTQIGTGAAFGAGAGEQIAQLIEGTDTLSGPALRRTAGMMAAAPVMVAAPLTIARAANPTINLARQAAYGGAVGLTTQAATDLAVEGRTSGPSLALGTGLGALLGLLGGSLQNRDRLEQAFELGRKLGFKGKTEADLRAWAEDQRAARAIPVEPLAPETPPPTSAEQDFVRRAGLEPLPAGPAADPALPAVPDNSPPTAAPAAPAGNLVPTPRLVPGPDSGAGSAPDLGAGVETAPARAPDLAAEYTAPPAPEPQSPAAPAGAGLEPSSGSAAVPADLPPAAGGQAVQSVPLPTAAVTLKEQGFKLINTYADRATAQSTMRPTKGRYGFAELPDGQVQVWFKPKARGFKIGHPPDGGNDLLSDIAELGGVAQPKRGDFGADGFAAAFGQGEARLLRRRAADGPDGLVQKLNGLGARDNLERGAYNFQSVDELYDAVRAAVQQRTRMASQLKQLEHEGRMSESLFNNTGRPAKLKAPKPVNVDKLKPGAEFTVRGEPVKVIGIDPDTGAVTIRNGAEITVPAGTPIYPDKGRVKQPKTFAPTEDMPFEETAAYVSANARYQQLRTLEREGRLDPAGQAELDQVEKTLGQDFLGFYSAEKTGTTSSLDDAARLQREDLQRRGAAPLQAADLQTQVDLFGPATDKAGQFSLFESTATRYLDARQLTNPTARAAVRGLLGAVWERRLARQLELDLATDAALASDLDPASRRLPDPVGQPGPALRLDRSIDPLPDARPGPQPGGLQLEARLYTQAFLAEGFLQHTGRKFEDLAQLVSAAQVLRNRNVETLWVLPYDAEGRLLAPFAFSSRLPNTVNLGEGYLERLRALLDPTGYHSYDLLHNHPSGDPNPSDADGRFTANIAQELPGFRRHLVINHGTYSVIEPDGFVSQRNIPVPEITSQPDATAVPQGTSKFIGAKINSESNAVALGYRLQIPAENIALFLVNTRQVIVASATVGAADLLAPDFPRHLAELARGTGSVAAFAYYDAPRMDVRQRLYQLKADTTLRDAIITSGPNQRIMTIAERDWPTTRRSGLYNDQPSVATRIADEDAGYETGEAEAPPASTHFVSQFDRSPVPQPLAQMPLVRAIEMPELVNLVKMLSGSIPALRKLPRAHGYMRGAGPGKVVLDRRIFTDPVFAQQVLAHELGHLVDYLPDRTLQRGNILGRLGTLRDYLKNGLPFDPAAPNNPLTPKERAALRRAAEKQVGAKPPKDEPDEIAEWQMQVRKAYSELIQAELEARGLVVARGRNVQGGANVVGAGDVGAELRNLSFWWRPLAADPSDHYLDYRNSSVEIYADTLSVLFNAPAEFRERAPTAWQMWFNYLDRKPEVKAELLATWDLLHQGAAAVSAKRVGDLRSGFAKAEEILLKKAEERAARRNSLPAIIEDFKQKHFNLYAPIIDKARQAKAAGARLKWHEDPEFVFDAHPLAENANYRFLDRIQKQALTPLEDLGLTPDALGDYLFFNRVAHEAYMAGDQLAGRGVIANPLGHTATTARRELLLMRYRLGPARYEALQQSARRFQDLALEVVERGAAAGIYSPEQLALARQNRHAYAAFAVVDFLEASPHIPAGFKQQRGTLREIANPFLATVLKMMTAHKLAEHNHAKRTAVQLLTRHFPGEIAQAPVTKVPLANGRIQYRARRAPDGKRDLVVLTDGKPITWHVEPDLADMFEHTPPASAHAILGVTNWVFRNVFYPAFLTYNPAFQLYASPIRDLSRSYVNLPPGVKRRHWLGAQIRAGRGARARLLNDITGPELQRRRTLRALAARRPLTGPEQTELQLLDDRALVIELLVKRGLTTPYESFAVNPIKGDLWAQMLADYRLAPNAPEHIAALRRWVGMVPGLGRLMDKIEFAGMTAEAMPKIGAYRILTRELGWTSDQAAYFIRNHVGTPNYTKRGKWAAWDGTIFPFINIFVRGLEADAQQMRGRIPGIPVDPSRQKSSYWRRMSERTLIPRLLQALAAAGLLGAGVKKYYDAWSEYNKTNYLILPLGTVHDGAGDFGYKSVGLRIPEDETARLMGGIIHRVVQLAATHDDPAATTSLANLANFAGGQVPGINPAITLADGWMQYTNGLNPRDRLRGNPVLSDLEFKAGGWPALKGMMAWTWDEVGGGNFVRYDPQAETWQEHMVGSLPILNRAVKITDTGLRERQRALESTLDTRNAKIRLAMPDNVNRLLGEYYRLNAIRTEHRTPLQAARLAELTYWHSKLWTPTYELLQESPPDTWRPQGTTLGDLSKAFEKP